MSELRKDPVTGRWVIISTERRKRPTDFRLERAPGRPATSTVRSAPGHEDLTPPEVLRVSGPNGASPNGPGWDLRVVPNKFPALQVEGGLDREGEGMFDRMNGIGAHEVIIETPRSRQDAGVDVRGRDRAGAVGVPRARARSEAGSAVPLHPDVQEPRRARRRDARALRIRS